MASPVTLSDPDRELIEVCTGDVFDVNYEASMWVVAAQPPSESSELMAEIEEQAVLDLDAPRWNPRSPTAHLHTELIIATPVHEASNFVQRKTLDAALGRARYKDFVKERVSAVFVFESSLRLPFGFASLTCGSPITVAICESSRREAAGQATAGDDAQNRKSRDDRLDIVAPAAIDASHKLKGYGPERAVDGDERTFWLVPGGQRMEMMSRDKWLTLDLGTARKPRALDLLGVVNSFGAARVLLDVGNSQDGPWTRAGCFRAFGSPMRWQRVELGRDVPTVRYMRLFVRREGHATFQHKVHGVLVHCDKKLG